MQFWVREREQYALNCFAKNKDVLEIGTFDGGSAKEMIESGANSVTTIDIFNPEMIQTEEGRESFVEVYKTNPVTFETARNHLKAFDNCNMIIGDSQKVLPRLKSESYDLIFIDGDHSHEGSNTDFKNSINLLKPGGLLAFHDNTKEFPGVQETIDEVRGHFEFREVYKVQSLIVFQKLSFFESKNKAVITYINDKFNYPEIFERDFLFSLRNFGYYFGKVYLIYGGNNERFVRKMEKFHNVSVLKFSGFEHGEMYTFRNSAIMTTIESLPAYVKDLLVADCDIIFQKNIVNLFSEIDNVSVIEESGPVVEHFINNCLNGFKNKDNLKIFKPLMEKSRKDKIYNSGMIIGNIQDVKSIIKRTDQLVQHTGEVEFGIDQLSFTMALLERQDYAVLPKIYNYSVASNRENLISTKNGFFDKEQGLIHIFHNTGANMKLIEQPIFKKRISSGNVACIINTKNRYFTTLPQCLSSIATQKLIPKDIIIYDDNDDCDYIDIAEREPFLGIIEMIRMRGSNLYIKRGGQKGQAHNHQLSLTDATTQYIWRIDDDCIAEPDCLLNLLIRIDIDCGAIAPLVLNVGCGLKPLPKGFTGSIDTASYKGKCIQWYIPKTKDLIEVQQLHSCFLFNREYALQFGGYDKNLSRIGHTEETIFSHEFLRSGYKIFVDPNARIWHMHSGGGIRTYIENKDLWRGDMGYFNKEIYQKKWGYEHAKERFVVLENGLGDTLAFIPVLEKMLKKYNNETVVIATGYPDVFERFGNNRRIETIDFYTASEWLGDLRPYSIYNFGLELEAFGKLKNKYEKTPIKENKSLPELYELMYLEIEND